MRPFFFLSVATTSVSAASFLTGKSAAAQWTVKQFNSLLTFGDSYTDESRLGYFINHAGSPPPPGTLLPESLSAADGGRVWARYVVQYTQQNTQLYNYAVSGAVCSNQITPRYFSYVGIDFPDLAGYEVPAFIADKKNRVNVATGKPLFQPALTKDNAVYAIWDGTNDLGDHAFIDDEEVPGASIPQYLDCIFDQVDALYAHGARYFVIMNVVPLYLAPQYANASFGGIGPGQYWQDKPTANITQIAEKMRQYVELVNAVYEYRVPYELLIKNRYPGANFALYDVNSLFLSIHTSPCTYLNGTTPSPETAINSYYHHCNVDGQNCTSGPGDRDSYMWYDELHPSEQTERVVAGEFVKVINGRSGYATYWSQ